MGGKQWEDEPGGKVQSNMGMRLGRQEDRKACALVTVRMLEMRVMETIKRLKGLNQKFGTKQFGDWDWSKCSQSLISNSLSDILIRENSRFLPRETRFP